MAKSSTANLNSAQLKAAFVEDLSAAWEHFRRKHPDHTPYAFVLYGVEAPVRLGPVVLTQESLDQVARRYMEEGYHETLDEARKALRYSVADSPVETELYDQIPTVDALVEPHADALLDGGSYAPLAKVGMAALKKLDEKGVFGSGKNRERIVLAVITDDTEEDWSAKSIKQLNPKSVFKRFQNETTFEREGKRAGCHQLAISRDGKSLYAAIWSEDEIPQSCLRGHCLRRRAHAVGTALGVSLPVRESIQRRSGMRRG